MPITPQVSIAAAPPPALDSHEAPTSPDDEHDGHSVPVCGVLFGEDDKEGVPVFRSKDGKPFGGAWGKARVKFFWPENKE